MKFMGIGLLALLLAPVASHTQTSAFSPIRRATVRGMLESAPGKNAKATPAPGILVNIESRTYTSLAVKSGRDGLYYIPNVPPGAYTLKVWADPKNPLTFTVIIKPPLTDIAPVIVPGASRVPPR